jgi:hypothetical protein
MADSAQPQHWSGAPPQLVYTDPEFGSKAADIVGLYLNPPESALVLAVDEKPSLQALERAQGYFAIAGRPSGEWI